MLNHTQPKGRPPIDGTSLFSEPEQALHKSATGSQRPTITPFQAPPDFEQFDDESAETAPADPDARERLRDPFTPRD